ncbi:hypothetical protein D1155_02465 [Anaerotruncus sp. 80]|uniref:Uncharacterized protein n=1 Tax=Anaerotruncus colihominis TaxID=169435 RepID=A0A845QKB0_9FIRM|nr:hypothetical protein [Anaerotruncus colihominis]NCE99540.1 hypothetical protein [Emergencia sp. 1XD21-10]NCF01192.1 hypothetical protein [Anaerotruncus sp. 80]
MLMHGKEARNQKQEIDCQHHTIPTMPTTTESLSFIHTCFQTAIMLMQFIYFLRKIHLPIRLQ